MTTFLVTGGCGFIGGAFISMVLGKDNGDKVINLDDLTYASTNRMDIYEGTERYKFVKGNTCQASLVEKVLCDHNPDVLVNFAAHTHVDRSIDGPLPFFENVLGTFALLEACRTWGHRPSSFRFIQVSTDEVYGCSSPGKPFTETARYNPSSPYSATKAGADHLVRAYHLTYGLPTLVTNSGNNYGPYQFPEKLIPLMIMNGIEGKELPVYGTGENIRSWIHVDDHCNALLTVIKKGVIGNTYNIGADCELANIEVVRRICDALDVRIGGKHGDLIRFVTDRPGHDREYVFLSEKIRRLGWSPAFGFELGILQTIDWYILNQDWVADMHDRGRLGNA